MAKNKRRTIAAGILALSALGFGDARGADLYAYFTRIQSGEPFERFARVGDHADVVVALGAPKGRLVFWRGSSYLPYWETSQGRWSLEEIVRREGDGDRNRPDRVNAFSHVLLVEDTPQRVTVAWRYLPRFQGGNPYRGVSATDFVEEYFAISPEGSVTRTIRRGTEKLDAWLDPSNRTVQMLQLAPDGVHELSRTAPGRSPAPAAVEGSPLRGPAPLPPALEWRFDEGTGNATKETVTGTVLEIPGHKSLWRKGVSGTCLQFDGYNTSIDFPAARVPAVGEGITLEAWIAIGAYPWNWCPIVQQGDDDGCFLGVGAHAEAGFKIKVGDAWHEAVAPRALGLFQWRHLAGTYDARTGLLRLYLDGKPVATKTIAPGPIRSSTDPIRIGQGKPREWTDPVGGSGKAVYAFDGLIDEVRVYGRALEPEQIAASLAPFGGLRTPVSRASPAPGSPAPVSPAPGSPTSALSAPDLAARALPKFDGGGRFGAHPTHLEYYDAWDALWRVGPHPDVAVTFDLLPGKFIFWRGAGYIPMLVNEREQWYSNEFNETWGRSGGSGCQEPMSDKKSLFNHVRVIENTPARVVIQWRYPLVDTQGNVIANFDPATGWGDWSDWYYSIYPDGVAVKSMRLWTSGPRNHEWHESMAILGPGQHPEQVVATDPALVLADLDGKATAYRWTDGPPRDVDFRDQKVHVVNYLAEHDPFTIGDFLGGNVYGGGAVPYSVFPTWNHWPEAQIPSDGRYASFADRAAHCSLTHVFLPDFRARHGDRPYQEKLLMEGLSPLGAGDLAPLARSWLRPPPVEALSDCRGPRYDPSQRAHVICASGASPTFRLTASPERPIVNPCFVVRNWNAEEPAVVRVDPALPAGGASPRPPRQGIVRDPNGRPTLVVWIECRSTVPTTFTLRGARPEGPALDGRSTAWAQAPGPAADDVFAIAMAVEILPGIGVEYLFECLDGPGRTSGWQEEPAYTDAGLSPDSEVAYRVKARDSYASETEWSPVHRTRTRAAPAPVTWSLDEGKGTTIVDTSGGHEGAIHGTVEWVEGVSGKALRLDGKGHVQLRNSGDLRSDGAFTWAAWIRTTRGGTILARSGPERAWTPGGKVLFVEDGHLRFDVGWVGEMGAETPVADGRWHHVAVTVSTAREGDNVRCFVDGRPGGSSRMEVAQHAETGLPVRIGFCNDDFPREGSAFVGDIDRVQWFHYALGPEAVARLAEERGTR